MFLKQIKYFVTVVDCNSFTKASELCYISQSAISQQIKSLELELGVELIHREHRSFKLTIAGEYLYHHGLILLDDAERLQRETALIGNHNEKVLKIGYLRCYGGGEFQSAIAEFSQKYPDVILEILNGNHEELYDLLRFGGVDVILNDQRRAFSNEYENLELVSCLCYAEVSKYSKLSSLEWLTLEDLRKVPCILVASKEQQAIERDFYQNTLGFNGNFIFAESLEEARLMVSANKGFLPIESNNHQSEVFKSLPLYRHGNQIYRKYCAFWKKDSTSVYVKPFAEILQKQFSTDTI